LKPFYNKIKEDELSKFSKKIIINPTCRKKYEKLFLNSLFTRKHGDYNGQLLGCCKIIKER